MSFRQNQSFFHNGFDKSRLEKSEIHLLEIYFHPDIVRPLSFVQAVDRLTDPPRNRFQRLQAVQQMRTLVSRVEQDCRADLREKVPAEFFG